MGRIAGFDGVRALSAIAVVFSHTVAGYSQLGGYAVNIFFALSGYLIIGILHRERAEIDAGRASVGQKLAHFWLRRIARIFPAYYVIGTIVILIYFVGHQLGYREIIFLYAYLQNFYIAITGTWIAFGYSWTLAVEQQFYILIGPLLLILRTSQHFRMLAFFSGFIFLLYEVLLMYTQDSFLIYHLPLFGFLLAAMGGLFAIGRGTPLSRLATNPAATVIITLAFILLSFVPSSFFARHTALDVVQTTANGFFIPALIAAVATHQASTIVRWLEHPVLLFYGKISYSLYLVHGCVADLIKEKFFPYDAQISNVALLASRIELFVIVLSFSTLLAWISYTFIEQRFSKLGRSY